MPSTKENPMQQQVTLSVGTLVAFGALLLTAFGGYYYYTSAMATKAQRIEKITTDLNNAKAKLLSLETKLDDLKRPNAVEEISELVTGKKQERLDKIQVTEKERLSLVKTRDDLKQELEALGK
jgi:F0F1-type ATP synthase membrane subunit b/b'